MKPNLASLLTVLCLSPLASALTELQQPEQVPPQIPAIHKVIPGDCFDKIARANACSVADLAAINGLPTDAVLQIGQELKLPTAPAPSTSVNTQAEPQESAAASPVEPPSHTIKTGDNFSKIAKLYGVSLDSLIAANPTIKPTAMRLGQKILLPESKKTLEQSAIEKNNDATTSPEVKDGSGTSPQTHETNSPSPETNDGNPSEPATASEGNHGEPDQQNPPPATPEDSDKNANDANDVSTTCVEPSARTIATDREMTYGELAALYGTETERLNSLNGLDLQASTIVVKGADLLVPTSVSN